MRVSERLLLLVTPAAALASIDLIVKATVPTASWAFHHRSGAWVVLCIALLVGAAFLCVVPSASVALAGGVMSAGVLGNLVSARADGNWVPNPLILSHGRFTVAFNLADVFFLLGNVLLMATLMAEVVRHRDRLEAVRTGLHGRHD
jgi:lipoprotein signal peptidase